MMMVIRSFSISILASLMLASCGTPYKAKMPSLNSACSKNLQDLHYQTLIPTTLSKKNKPPEYIEFADIAQCLCNEHGNQAIALYLLQSAEPHFEINISVQLSSGGTLAATAVLLGADMKPLHSYGFADFVRRGDEYTLTVFLDGGNAATKYILISPDTTSVGKVDSTPRSISNPIYVPIAPGMGAMLANGRETRINRPLMMGGRVRIVLENTSSAAF